MSSRVTTKPARERSVFINCPFDHQYQPLLRAACFTILACGRVPRCALDFADSGSVRLNEIVELIAACDYSLHDISRVETPPGLPRFNMPFELGVDLGLRLKGPAAQRRRKTLILDALPHRYDKTLSDISGMDPEAHGNDPVQVIKRVRDWLNTHRHEADPFPGGQALHADYVHFEKIAPDIIAELRLDSPEDLQHHDYLFVVERALPLIADAAGLPTSSARGSTERRKPRQPS